jgi:hypothetical protein
MRILFEDWAMSRSLFRADRYRFLATLSAERPVMLAAEAGHFRADRVGGELRGLAVEGLDFYCCCSTKIWRSTVKPSLWWSQWHW